MKAIVFCLAASLALGLLLGGCGPADASTPAQSGADSSQSAESRIGLASSGQPDAVTLQRDEDFYTTHALYYDASFLPLYDTPEDLTEAEKYWFFLYFVSSEGLFHAGQDFYSTKDQATCIPIGQIESVLMRYLGVGFDAMEAFGEERAEMGDGITPYGYDPGRGIYVQGEINPWVAADRMVLIAGEERLSEDTVRLTFQFYYTGDLGGEESEDAGPLAYKQKIMTFKESPTRTDEYSILENIDIYTVDGIRIEVKNDTALSELRPYIQHEPWYR